MISYQLSFWPYWGVEPKTMKPPKLNERQIFALKVIASGQALRRVVDEAASKYTRFQVSRWFAGETDITAQTKSLRKRGLIKSKHGGGFKLSKAGEDELAKVHK